VSVVLLSSSSLHPESITTGGRWWDFFCQS